MLLSTDQFSVGTVGHSDRRSGTPGVFTTKPVQVGAKTLMVNAVSSNGGGVRVAVLPVDSP
eukprot:COSAG03_NODE_20052_length_325_cov_0.898230_1_plen_60_part_10